MNISSDITELSEIALCPLKDKGFIKIRALTIKGG